MVKITRILTIIIIFSTLQGVASPLGASEDIGTILVEEEEEEEEEEAGASEDPAHYFDRKIYSGFEDDTIDSDTYLKDAPAQKRITTEQAMNIPGSQGDPLKAIKVFPGVTSQGDENGLLFIHGSKPRENYISINRLPIGYLYHLGGRHSVLGPENIDQIDVYLGGFDAGYGNAMGGVIDVSPRYPMGEKSGFIHMGFYDSSMGTSFPIAEELNISIGGRRSYYDLLAPKTGSLADDVTYTRFPNFYDGNLTLSYTMENGLVALEVLTSHDGLTIDTQELKVKDPEASGEISADSSFTTTGLRWIYNNGGRYSANTLVYHFVQSEETRLFSDYQIKIDYFQYGFFHSSRFEISDSHQLNAGLEFDTYRVPLDLYISRRPALDDVAFDFTTAEKFRWKESISSNRYGFFLQDVYTFFNERLSVKSGIRLDDSDDKNIKPEFSPRFAIVYRLNPSHSLSVSGGWYSQFPDGEKNNKVFGNELLSHERSKQIVLNYTLNIERRVKLMIEPYYKKFTDLVVSDKESKYNNNGNGYSYGVDLSYTHAVSRKLNLMGSYTFLQAKRKLASGGSSEKFFGEIPHTLQLLGSYNLGNFWIFGAKIKYASGHLYTPVIGSSTFNDGRIRPLYGSPFSRRYPAYFSLDVRVSKKIFYKSSNLEISVELSNLTNHRNVSKIKYDDLYNIAGYEKQLPLMPWIDLVYRF